MSLNSADYTMMSMNRDEMSNGGGSDTANARNVPLLRPEAGMPYSVWRTEMETYMMRAGIEKCEYKEAIPEWSQLIQIVEFNAANELRQAMDQLLNRVKVEAGGSSSSISTNKKVEDATAASRKLVVKLVNSSKRAYGLLYTALAADLRALIEEVPQGYAYGLWELLEDRFESKRDDNVADHWMRFISLAQDPNEAYDTYMARVDKVTSLLDGAGQTPHAGLRKVILLDRLLPKYKPASLAYLASKRLNANKEIDWLDVKTFMFDHERQMNRDDGASASTDADRAMAARAAHPPNNRGGAGGPWNNQTNQPPHDMSKVKCYNCNGLGHMSRSCTKERKPRRDNDSESNRDGWRTQSRRGGKSSSSSRRGDSGSDDDHPTGSVHATEQVFAIGQAGRFAALSDIEDDENVPSLPRTFASMAARERKVKFASTHNDSSRSREHKHKRTTQLGVRSNRTASSTNEYDASSSETDDDASTHGHQRVSAATTKASKTSGSSDRSASTAASSSAAAAASSSSSSSSSHSAAKEKAREENQQSLDLRRENIASRRDKTPIDTQLKEYAWGLDTMASLSVTGNRALLTNVKKCTPIPIKVADGAIILAEYKGNVTLRLKKLGEERTINVEVEDVYWNDRFDANLLSWGRLRVQKWKLSSDENGTFVVLPRGTKIAIAAKGHVSMLEMSPLSERVYSAKQMHLAKGRVVCSSVNELVRYHQLLAHAGYDRLLNICRSGRTDGIGSIAGLSAAQLAEAKERISCCKACIQGKMPRPSFGSRGLDSGQRPGEVLHVDTAHITLPPDSSTGKKSVAHWLICTDPYSEGRFTNVCDTKDELPNLLIAIVLRCQQMTGKRVKFLYCDNGSEFINKTVKTFCQENRTTLSAPPPNTPELRGVAERNVRSFKDCARTMLVHSGAHVVKTWRYAARYQAYLWNRTRLAKRTGLTPIESLSGRTPSILHTGVFGCDAWVHRDRNNRDSTFDAKAQPGVYLGHDDNKHGAQVLMLSTGKVVRTRDVELRQTSFTHMAALNTNSVDRIVSRPWTSVNDEDDKDELFGSSTNTRTTVPTATQHSTAAHGSSRKGGRVHDSHLSSITDESEFGSDEEQPEPKPSPSSAVVQRPRRYEVEQVLAHRPTTRGGVEYQIKWLGFKDTSWEPKRNLTGAPERLAEYLEKTRVNAPTSSSTTASSSASSSSNTPASNLPSSDDSSDERGSEPAVMQVLRALQGCSRL